jgi:hypothetical protein
MARFGAVGTSRGLRGSTRLRGVFAWGQWWTAGEVEEALVLLVGLVEHGRQLGNMLPVVPLPFLGGLTGILEFITQELDLFAENVYDDVRRRLRTSADICLWLSAVICPRTSVGVFALEICGSGGRVCGRLRTSFDDVRVRRDADKFRLVDEAVRGGAQFALVNQFVESAAGNAKLARRVRFGESGHGRS